MQKTIALVAHDHRKPDLVKWSLAHKAKLSKHKLVATGTTGGILQKALNLDVHCFNSGPLGGDQQIGALIAEQKLDCLVFFWDPLNPAPHDPDVKALLRMCSVWNIPVACNMATADMIVTSPLFVDDTYLREIPNF
ncbi:methylglyoxal synthase [Paraglaciecola arctica]|uniref:Methylglyoxal synthase n=1 Tax=Paraglaciecola arctica BSs20135 TaxID=493475 RepID=K6YVA8_9ALTE|nr:methylglyoxal synthase [Paraglaciecola arctica]GAC22112.1 methylglyoxal synthase [Paraglaciecola arctica BSs20135]|tara:strand:- start:8452 stop:8859 length:408 start_codon:yes stop_codon:yes gene_type:complete